MSPFCDADALKMLTELESKKEPRLVSRSEELVSLPPTVLERFAEILVLDELAENEDGEGDDSDDEMTAPLSGLHAKAFVQDIGWDTAITIGSGNATRPALITGRNVEVFATLTGKRSKVGSVADILGPDGFGRVLRPFRAAEISPPDSEQVAAEQRVEEARRELATAGLRIRCAQEPTQENSQRLWRLAIQAEDPLKLDGLSAATTWPITRGENHACNVLVPLREGLSVEIGSMQLLDVTRFLGFRLVDESGKARVLFTLGLAIEGLPADRHRAILRWVINSREAFLRYLRLLLADLSDPLSAQLAAGRANGTASWSGSADSEPILEDMVRALSHDRGRLDAVRNQQPRGDEGIDQGLTCRRRRHPVHGYPARGGWFVVPRPHRDQRAQHRRQGLLCVSIETLEHVLRPSRQGAFQTTQLFVGREGQDTVRASQLEQLFEGELQQWQRRRVARRRRVEHVVQTLPRLRRHFITQPRRPRRVTNDLRDLGMGWRDQMVLARALAQRHKLRWSCPD